jgi:hypothetical protein
VLFVAPLQAGQLPVTGSNKDFLAKIDREMQKIMQETGYKAATMAAKVNGITVFNRGYGYQNSTLTKPINPNVRMRISIIERCLTSILIRHLLQTNTIKPETRVFEYLQAKPYHGMVFDKRVYDITVQHLLDHKLGWDTWNDAWSANQQGKMQSVFGTEQLSVEQINSYMLTQHLQSDPGTINLFTEYAQTLIRALVSKATGKPYLKHLSEFVQAYGVNIQPSQKAEQRHNEEIWYQPENHGWRDAVAISALDLVTLFDRFWISGDKRLGNGASYAYFSVAPGASAILRQRSDGVNYAIIFNQSGKMAIGDIDKRINKLFDALN